MGKYLTRNHHDFFIDGEKIDAQSTNAFFPIDAGKFMFMLMFIFIIDRDKIYASLTDWFLMTDVPESFLHSQRKKLMFINC